MEQDVKTMEMGTYWFWPERGREFTAHRAGKPKRDEIFVLDRNGDAYDPIIVEVYRKAPSGGFLYASPYLADWPIDWTCEGGDTPSEIRVCDLPGLWVRVPDPPSKEEVYGRAHFKTPCDPVDTKE